MYLIGSVVKTILIYWFSVTKDKIPPLPNLLGTWYSMVSVPFETENDSRSHPSGISPSCHTYKSRWSSYVVAFIKSSFKWLFNHIQILKIFNWIDFWRRFDLIFWCSKSPQNRSLWPLSFFYGFLVWFGTKSIISFIPNLCISVINSIRSSLVPNSWWTLR